MNENTAKYEALPMDSIVIVFSFIIFLSFISCESQVDYRAFTLENNPSAQALKTRLDSMTLVYKPVTICGKIDGYNHGRSAEELEVYINDAIKSEQVFFYDKINKDGTFEVEIELAHAQDIMIKYQRVFSIFATPGDSIYFVFNGRTRSRPRIYKTITFTGDQAETNTQLARYWYKYYRNRDLGGLRRAQKNLEYEDFEDYTTKLFDRQQNLRATILDDMDVNDMTLLFTQLDIELDFHIRNLEYFMRERRIVENCENILNIIESMPIWKKSSLINSKIKSLVNDMHFLVPVTIEKVIEDNLEKDEDRLEHMVLAHKEANTNQPLLKELIFNEIASQHFAQYNDLGAYLNIISLYIQNPLIAEKLNIKLEKVLEHNQDPNISNKINLDQIKAIDEDNIIQSLIDQHKDKVLYIDFWGTYCAPCISEMMVSNDMHDSYSDKSIAFIYLCIDGVKRKNKWDRIVNGKGLKGHHVRLTEQQSNNLMKGIGFTGVPFYLILDHEGKMIEKGSHLRPSSSKATIIIENLIGVN